MYKILSDNRLEIKFHFIHKSDGCSASSAALQQLQTIFERHGSARLYKGVVIFTSQKSFSGDDETEKRQFADNLENELYSAIQQEGEFELISLD